MQFILATISEVDTRSATIWAVACTVVDGLPSLITSASTEVDTATSAIARTIGTNWGWTWDGDSYELEGWSTSQLIQCVENTDPLAGADPPTFDPVTADALEGPSQGTNA